MDYKYRIILIDYKYNSSSWGRQARATAGPSWGTYFFLPAWLLSIVTLHFSHSMNNAIDLETE